MDGRTDPNYRKALLLKKSTRLIRKSPERQSDVINFDQKFNQMKFPFPTAQKTM